jgi:hypothetical protein
MSSIEKSNLLPPRLLDITTLAEHLGVNTRHIRRLVVASDLIPPGGGQRAWGEVVERLVRGENTTRASR